MKFTSARTLRAILISGVTAIPLIPAYAFAQQKPLPPSYVAPADAPEVTTEKSLNIEHDKVKTSAEHIYNSPAERANDDLLITEVKSSLAERGISDQYPVEVDADHGTILLSGVVASADDARQAEQIAMNTKGVVGVKNHLTWR